MNAPSLTLHRSNRNDPTLRYDVHRPSGEIRGAVFLTHGYAEHSGRYGEVIDALNARGLIVARWDLRGHGHSDGARGHVLSFDDYLRDADELRVELAKDTTWRNAGPPVMIGHSLGGLITFHAAARDPGSVRGVILSSPFFGIKVAVPAVKRAAGKVMSKVFPGFGLPTGLKGTDVTRNTELALNYDKDPLHFPNATARWFTEATRAHELALDQARDFHLPILIMAGGDDKIASLEATKKVFERIGSTNKELRVLDSMYHEIFNEPERARWIADAADAATKFIG
ncbi:MAG: alpha/beta hydrolase [Polyangiaceae bacterium]